MSGVKLTMFVSAPGLLEITPTRSMLEYWSRIAIRSKYPSTPTCLSPMTWTSATPPPDAGQRRDALAVTIGDSLYLISGTVAGEPTTRVDAFTGY